MNSGNQRRRGGSKVLAAFAILLALLLLSLSLLRHGPAWLADSALSAASGGELRIDAAEGHWHTGQGRLHLSGVAETLPLSWKLEGRGLGLAMVLEGGIQGEVACDLRAGCVGDGLAGRLPGSWLLHLAPALASVGLEGQLDWQVRRLQWTPAGGGSLAVDGKTDALYAAKLGLPLGWYVGSLQGNWSGAEKAPRLSLQLHSAPPAGIAAPLTVSASGQAGPHAVEIAGQLSLPAQADPRYSRLLQMLGLTPTGGPFRYRSGG